MENTGLMLRHLPLLPNRSPEDSVEGSVDSKSGFSSIAKKRSAAETTTGYPRSPAFELGDFPLWDLTTYLLFHKMNSLYLWFGGQWKVQCGSSCCRASWSRGGARRDSGKPVHLNWSWRELSKHSGHQEGQVPQKLPCAQRTCSVFGAFCPTNPDLLLPQGLGTWILPQNWGGWGRGLFLNKITVQSWGFF